MNHQKNNFPGNDSIAKLFAFLPHLMKKYPAENYEKQFKMVYSKILSQFSSETEKVALFYTAGMIQFENCLYNDAIHSFSEVLYNRPEHDSALLMRSLCYSRIDKKILASADAASATIYNPENPEAFFIKAVMDFNNHDTSSIHAIQTALRLNPENAVYHVLQAKIYQKMNQTKKAISSAKESYLIDPCPYTAFILAKFLFPENMIEAAHLLAKSLDFAPARFFFSQIALAVFPERVPDILKPLNTHPLFNSSSKVMQGLSLFRIRKFYPAAELLLTVKSPIIFNPMVSYIISLSFYFSGCFHSALAALDYAGGKNKKKNIDKKIQRKILILKCKILLKQSEDCRENTLVVLKILETQYTESNGEWQQIERLYRKLFKKYHFLKDKKQAKILRNMRLNLRNSQSSPTPRWVYSTIIIILIIFLLLEIISRSAR